MAYRRVILPAVGRVELRKLLDVEVLAMLANKPPLRTVGGPSPFDDDKPFRIKFPRTWDYLTQDKWEDGSPRQLATVSIFPDGGMFKIMLKDANFGLLLFASADNLTDLWASLEARLIDPGADWRVDRKAKGDQAKRVRHPKP